MQHWKILIAALTVAGLAACSSTPEKAAQIEDKGSSQGASSPTSGSGSQTSGVAGQGAGSGNALPSGGSAVTDPLKDPRSPLSKRIVYFDYDSFVVKSEYRPLLEAHAAYLKANSSARVVIEGNTDERGSREYNLALGQKRAEAVRQMFTLLGVNGNQIETVSFGEEKPRNPALTDAAFSENRRDELRYAGE